MCLVLLRLSVDSNPRHNAECVFKVCILKALGKSSDALLRMTLLELSSSAVNDKPHYSASLLCSIIVFSVKLINDLSLYSSRGRGNRCTTLAQLSEVCNEKKDRMKQPLGQRIGLTKSFCFSTPASTVTTQKDRQNHDTAALQQ